VVDMSVGFRERWPIRCVWCERIVSPSGDWEEATRHWDACRTGQALDRGLKTHWRAWFRGAEGGRD
jgi:hypothetical protein